jgi:predicted RNase H-like HicB family nuclease
MILFRFERVSYIIRRMEANGTYTFTMLFEPAEEGGYVVTCPALPGLVTEGDTLEEARRMAEDALRGYLESLLEDGVSIPPDKTPIAEPIEIALAL